MPCSLKVDAALETLLALGQVAIFLNADVYSL
jgi:hypothetical protein